MGTKDGWGILESSRKPNSTIYAKVSGGLLTNIFHVSETEYKFSIQYDPVTTQRLSPPVGIQYISDMAFNDLGMCKRIAMKAVSEFLIVARIVITTASQQIDETQTNYSVNVCMFNSNGLKLYDEDTLVKQNSGLDDLREMLHTSNPKANIVIVTEKGNSNEQ